MFKEYDYFLQGAKNKAENKKQSMVSTADSAVAQRMRENFFDLQPTSALKVINAKQDNRPMTDKELAAHQQFAIKFFGLDKMNFFFKPQNTK